MSTDTQNNKFTPDEEQFMEQIASTLRKHRESEAIQKAVSSKVAGTNFTAPTAFMQTAAGKIMVIGSLAIIATLTVMLITTERPQGMQDNKYTQLAAVDTASEDNSLTVAEDSVIEETKKPARKKQKETGAVPGLPIASSGPGAPKTVNTHLNELSFLQVYQFNTNANVRTFKKDLKAQLDKMNLKFSDKSNKDEVINFVSQKTKGVDEEQRPVIYYIIAKVEKRFPGNLKMSLRYYPDESGDFDGGDKTINTIFYNNLKARVSGLINWKYKPEENK